MLVKDGSLYIGGNFNQAGDVIANHVVRYDGSNFYPLGGKPANGFATPPSTYPATCTKGQEPSCTKEQ